MPNKGLSDGCLGLKLRARNDRWRRRRRGKRICRSVHNKGASRSAYVWSKHGGDNLVSPFQRLDPMARV